LTGKYRPGQDLEMMQDPDEWPRWPQLCLKRTGDYLGPRYGFLVAIPELKPIVWHGIVGTVQANRPCTEYINFRELLADGWLVD
jgi:hypothetical protein